VGNTVMKKYPSQNLLREIFVYNNGEMVWAARGYGRFDKQFAGRVAGNITKNGYKNIRLSEYGLIMCHMIVWIYHNGEIPGGFDIDHIDGDRLNNRLENLRLCTRSQNLFNMKIRKDNASGVKGLSWNEKSKSWRARISVNKIKIEVGSFPKKESAIIAIKEARAKHHGDFSRHAVCEESL
jgi:hypothetical protein